MMPPIVIIAGGVASRLRPLTINIPKSMLLVAGKPFIEHQLLLLKEKGFRRVVICSGYLSKQIEDCVGDGGGFGLSVNFSIDGERLLGTGGAIKKALPLLTDVFFVTYGDSYLDINYEDIYSYYCLEQKVGLMTILKNENEWDKSNADFVNKRIVAYDKSNVDNMRYIDYGLSILNKTAFETWKENEIFDLAELYKKLIAKEEMLGYEVVNRFYEIGSSKGLEDTERYLLGKMGSGGKNG